MLVIGLTGSIAMGKSTAAGMFRRLGVPVYDADAAVHALLAKNGEGVEPINQAFPGVVTNGVVDRKALGARVFGDAIALRMLEAILHPLVAKRRALYLARAARQKKPVVVLDIPLLFETGADRICDAVIVVTAPKFLQLQRLMQRPGMDSARVNAVLARQMPDTEKRKRADFIVASGLGRARTLVALRRCLGELHKWQRGQAIRRNIW